MAKNSERYCSKDLLKPQYLKKTSCNPSHDPIESAFKLRNQNLASPAKDLENILVYNLKIVNEIVKNFQVLFCYYMVFSSK